MNKSIAQIVIGIFWMAGSLFLPGCVSVDGKKELSPHKLGRDVTVVYLLGKKKIDPKKVEAVKEVYSAFSNAMAISDQQLANEVKAQIHTAIEKRITDPEIKLIARAALDMYWQKLMGNFDLDAMAAADAYIVLGEFHSGIESALQDYHYLR
jgi:hypothetical protein